MDRLRTGIVRVSLGVIGMVAAACAVATSSGSPGPVPSAVVAAIPTPAATASPTFAGKVVDIVAKDRAFSITEFEVDAGQAFRIRFDNEDPYKHALYINKGPRIDYATLKEYETAPSLLKGEYITGPLTVTYDVAELKPGTYTFFCPPHREMNGTIVVK